MGKPPSKRRGGGRGGYKTSSDEKGSSSGTTGKYRAPTVGYEDHIFSHGNTNLPSQMITRTACRSNSDASFTRYLAISQETLTTGVVDADMVE